MAAVTQTPGTAAPKRGYMRGRRPRLRVAVFADHPLQPRWMVEALARIAQSDFADVVLVAACTADRRAPPWLWRTCLRLDRALFAGADLSEPVPLRAAMPLARHVGCRGVGEMAAAWRDAGLTHLLLDVAFVLGDIDDAELEGIARYGVWRYSFGAAHGRREDLAGWQEVARGLPVTASGLRIALRRGAARLLCQSRARTYPFSPARNRANLFRKTALFLGRELRLLHRQGDMHIESTSAPAPPPPAERTPGAGEVLRGLVRIAGRVARRGVQKLCCIDQWFIAWRFGPPNGDGDLSRYARLLPPKDRMWADPFPLHHGERYFVFFEEVVFASGKGRIAVVELARDGSHSAPVTVLERDYHLSYPFLIAHGGELFMVPESGENRSVELYRCERFPDVWRFEKTLLDDLPCADATFHQTDGRWWMFVNSGAEHTELYDELHLFYARDLRGEWHAHASNPVKSDVCGARPAGGLFLRDGILHRPAQICAPLYGSGIAIARVERLTPCGYRETEIARLVPPKASGVLGIHTLNRSGELSVVDGFMRRSRL